MESHHGPRPLAPIRDLRTHPWFNSSIDRAGKFPLLHFLGVLGVLGVHSSRRQSCHEKRFTRARDRRWKIHGSKKKTRPVTPAASEILQSIRIKRELVV